MIVPDTSDWTWVLERPCPECGFDASTAAFGDVASLVRANAAAWEQLHVAGRIARGRPNPQTWSSLEYACHVRDVYRRYHERVRLMLAEDDPLFPNWDQDATAEADRYEDQDPGEVVAELRRAADRMAALLEDVTEEQAARPGRRGDGASFSVSSIARYMVHDPVHHVWDVRQQHP